MAWNISAGAIKNPIPPILLIMGLVFAGLTAYAKLPINQLPNIEFPEFIVSVSQPGAAPVEMENQIAQRVEAALTTVQGVRRVNTTIRPGNTMVDVELQIGADLNRAVEDARDALTRIRPDLPADITEPVIYRQDAAAQPIAYFAVEAPSMTDEQRSWFIDNDLSRALLAVPGVNKISRDGGVDREVRVELDPERLTAYGITADAVSRNLRSMNADLPGGQAEVSGQAQSIRTLGSAGSVAELSEMRLTGSNGQSVRLGDLGTVTDSASEATAITRFNGQPVVSFAVSRAKNASEVRVFDAVQARLHELQQAHPGVHFRLIFTPVDFIRGMYESSISALLEGALLACIVVFLTLRDWRATAIAAAAIPLAIIPTFAALQLFGFTINMMTLIALALVAGVLVDDAIVEIENIVRHIRMGKKPYDASMEAADEIGLAVVATSASIIAVFVPVGFMGSQTGQWFKEFGLTVAIATFFSLVVARLITPMMCAHFLKDNGHEEPKGDMVEIYRGALNFAIRNPWKTLGGGVIIFALSLVMAFFVPKTFIPRFNSDSVQESVEIPPGTPLAEADRAMRDLAARAATAPEVANVYTELNGSEGAATGGTLFALLKDRSERRHSAYWVQQQLRPLLSGYPNYRVSVLNNQGGGRGADITVQFVGDNPQLVNAAAERMATAMQRLPQLADAHSSAALQRPELQIHPRPDDLARLGVTNAAIASAVRIATSGDVEQNLPRFDLPDRQIPIRVVLRPDMRSNVDTIRALPVQSTLGAPVRLDAVANVDFGLGEVSIERRDRERAVTVSANVIRGDIGAAQQAVFRLPEGREPGTVHRNPIVDLLANFHLIRRPPPLVDGSLPAGVHLATTGDTEQMADMFDSFGSALLWGLLLIYGVLVLLFRDFYHPWTIMTALPLSIGGAFVGLLISNQPLSLFVLIGLIMLMGIVTKNSILLVDFAIEQMHKGMPRDQALMEAGMKRARPILMTTFAMAAGMLPSALGWSVDGSLRQGMGCAVIGGLLVSTLLSLLFVPANFVLIDKLERFLSKLFGWKSRHDVIAAAQAAE
ncbi:MAG: efflux RND transporter permease subunit [Proteobacteria bacterium]|nr:efflux RND transporter permease subunit [Pseudomonadota bacterium]